MPASNCRGRSNATRSAAHFTLGMVPAAAVKAICRKIGMGWKRCSPVIMASALTRADIILNRGLRLKSKK